MPTAISAASVWVASYLGTSSIGAYAVAYYGTQLAIYSAVGSLLAPDAPKAGSNNVTITGVGGEVEERIIFGRVKTGGSYYMLQKTKLDDGNEYVYQGVTLQCRHPIKGYEQIWFNDKPSTHPDFTESDFAIYRLTFESLSTAGDFTVTLDGVDYVTTLTAGEFGNGVLDKVLLTLPNSLYYEYEIGEEITVERDEDGHQIGITVLEYLQIERVDTSSKEWNIDIQISGQVSSNPELYRTRGISGESNFRLISTNGDQTAAHTTLVAELDNNNAPQRWTSAHILKDIPHYNFRWRADWLKDNLGRMPAVQVVAAGHDKILDPRDGTKKHTNNAALCLRHYLTLPWGFNATAEELPDAYWIAAANVCDEDVPTTTAQESIISISFVGTAIYTGTAALVISGDVYIYDIKVNDTPSDISQALYDLIKAKTQKTYSVSILGNNDLWLRSSVGTGGIQPFVVTLIALADGITGTKTTISEELTQKRYTFDGVIGSGTQPGDALKLFSDAMQAPVVWSGGQWLIRPAAWTAPLISLDQHDLSGNIQVADKISTKNRFNVVQGTFTNEYQEWQKTDYPSIIIDDGMPEQIGNLALDMIIDATRAQRIAHLHLKLSQEPAVLIPIKRLPDYIPVDTMINLTIPALDWTDRTMYITNREDNEDGTAVLTAVNRTESMFAWNASQAVEMDTLNSSPVFEIK